MKYPISSSSLPLVLTAALAATACGRSNDDRESSTPSSNPLVPAGFQNTADPEAFKEKNQQALLLLQSIEQQFGMKMQDPTANDSSLILTQTALQAFIGAKADSTLLSRSLEIEASMTLMTRLLSDQPSSCTAVLVGLEALYTTLTVAANEAVTYSNYEQLQKTAQRLGMELEQRPAPADAAFAFHLTGSSQWPGYSLNQELDFSAGANDRYVFVKRDAKLTSTLSRPGQDEKPDAAFGHYTYTATGGLSADLLQKQLVMIDQRQADLDMTRNGAGLRGSSHLDIHSRVQGGEQPAVTTELNLNLQGQGLADEVGFPLYSEQRRFTSQLTKVDANTLRLSLALASQGVKGTKNLSVDWLLQKNAKGECAVTRPGH